MEKPFSSSCESNKGPILEALKDIIKPHQQQLLEVGSGTGQHAVHIAPHFPHLNWQCSDQKKYHPGINAWISDVPCPNILRPIEYQVGKDNIDFKKYDTIFTANTLHIMSWELVLKFFSDLSDLNKATQVIIYGPFNSNGNYTSASNEKFDFWLKNTSGYPEAAIRNQEDVIETLSSHKIEFKENKAMPKNNRLLIFEKL